MKEIVIFILAFCCTALFPLLVIGQMIFRKLDKRKQPTYLQKITILSKAKNKDVEFIGAYTNESPSYSYTASFMMNGKRFTECIPKEIYSTMSSAWVTYVIGRSGKWYIEKIA